MTVDDMVNPIMDNMMGNIGGINDDVNDIADMLPSASLGSK